MAGLEVSSELPNLKIEIENSVPEAMEAEDVSSIVDSNLNAEDIEEGEISDSKDTEMDNRILRPTFTVPNPLWEPERRYENRSGGFVTGVDVFDENEQKKLNVRAKRFGLDPSEMTTVSEKQLNNLYESLGIKIGDTNTEKSMRLNALHIRGTENMSTQDIFGYFKDYGPASIEWINDYSCNVVWLDELSAARALLGLSKQIKGLEEFHSMTDPFLKDEEKKKTAGNKENQADEDVVVLEQIQSQDGQIIMVVDEVGGKNEEETDMAENPKSENVQPSIEDPKGTVDARDITIPIPPGFWRKGVECSKAKCILLRFSTRNDRKPPQAEKLSEYYRIHGNPNYGGIRGIITASRKRRYQMNETSKKVFDDDLGDYSNVREDPVTKTDSKNPWGTLAKSWSSADRSMPKKTYPYEGGSPPTRLSPPPAPPLPPLRSTYALKRIRAETQLPVLHSDDVGSASSSDDYEDDSGWKKRSKVPRMRMYADEEEVRIEKRRATVKSSRHRRDHHSNRREESSNGETRMSSRVEERLGRVKSDPKPKSVGDLRSRLKRDNKGSRNHGSNETKPHKHKSSWEDYKVSADWEDENKSESDSGSGGGVVHRDLRDTLSKNRPGFEGNDLRSKLNLKKTMKLNSRQKSPLRIEIDNDEYYRLIDSDQD